MSVVLQVADTVRDAFYAISSCFCPSDAHLKLNGRTFKILKLLGEGGFSYVYLVEDTTSGRQFALKKIRCPLGSDSVKSAMKEVEAYRRFRHPNIIRCLDSCVVQDKENGEGKIIYLFLPYYSKGNIQSLMNANSVNGTKFPESSLLSLFLGTCLAVRAMHMYEPGPSASYPPSFSISLAEDLADNPGATSTTQLGHFPTDIGGPDDDDEDEEETSALTEENGHTGGAVGGSTKYQEVMSGDDASRSTVKLSELPSKAVGMENDAQNAENEGVVEEEGKPKMQPWAHRDIKPANIMVSDDGRTPILMDFGSALPARIPIPNRSVALTQQDLAAEHCSMPFRAPELFDVKTGVPLDEKVDIWSLGGTLFAMAYGYSPFETPQQVEHGGSIAMAVLGGSYKFPPEETTYSQGLRDLISMMLVLDPQKRPDIHQVIEETQKCLDRLR
ncbi:Pkinase-domain-containing protein [Atractiella rhizophila]|nr:Pkinase-domain-containing protein [Atractiella rhizophila]